MSASLSSALCNTCGSVRTVKVSGDGTYRPPGFDIVDSTCDLRCNHCRVVTRHALCLDGPSSGDDARARGPRPPVGVPDDDEEQWRQEVERGLQDAGTWIDVRPTAMWYRGWYAGASGRHGYVAGVYAGLVTAHDRKGAEAWLAGAEAGASDRLDPSP